MNTTPLSSILLVIFAGCSDKQPDLPAKDLDAKSQRFPPGKDKKAVAK